MENVFFLIIGIVMTAIGVLYPALIFKRRRRCNARITATVIRIEKKTHYVGKRTEHKYRPTFSYIINGRQCVAESDLETLNMLKYKVGDKVEIRYDPKSPETVAVGVNVFPYVCGVLLIVFGILLVICSL